MGGHGSLLALLRVVYDKGVVTEMMLHAEWPVIYEGSEVDLQMQCAQRTRRKFVMSEAAVVEVDSSRRSGGSEVVRPTSQNQSEV